MSQKMAKIFHSASFQQKAFEGYLTYAVVFATLSCGSSALTAQAASAAEWFFPNFTALTHYRFRSSFAPFSTKYAWWACQPQDGLAHEYTCKLQALLGETSL